MYASDMNSIHTWSNTNQSVQNYYCWGSSTETRSSKEGHIETLVSKADIASRKVSLEDHNCFGIDGCHQSKEDDPSEVSKQRFNTSVCPSDLGWYAVE
ncbi:hypothetical protein E3N88_07890 [Mikania micrantha]|uniref:Uncharacterized protein n=1 Tax=Mikania micrantha TaxID=192012 RepID=A0A5N6PHS5_9ASTR|nr:hypothetical protein E3N88_07890 [Mikania micrantha]